MTELEEPEHITTPMHPMKPWPDPTTEMIASPEFEAIWQCIKSWDINVPHAYSGYMHATGNHVRAILEALVTDKKLERALAEIEQITWREGKGFEKRLIEIRRIAAATLT
jgi:hypothetical protein